MEAANVLIRVYQEWDGWKNAEVRLEDLENPHWFQPSRAREALLHAYLKCTLIVSGEIPHECEDGSTPHRLRVCLLKRHIGAAIYEKLAQFADEARELGRAMPVIAPGLADPGSPAAAS